MDHSHCGADLWNAFVRAHAEAQLAGAPEIQMDYFTRAVESLLGQGKRLDSSLLKLDEGHWMRAVEDSGYVAATLGDFADRVIPVTMLPILIMPDAAPESEDETSLEANDAEIELDDIQDLWELSPQAGRRARVPLGPWVELRHPVPPITQSSDAVPASLQDCDQFLKLLLRRKADSLGRRERAELRMVLHATNPASSSIATLSPETATWLLWAMSWRGVSTPRQLVFPPLHAPTLVVQWWTSTPTTLCFGSAAPLLRVFA